MVIFLLTVSMLAKLWFIVIPVILAILYAIGRKRRLRAKRKAELRAARAGRVR